MIQESGRLGHVGEEDLMARLSTRAKEECDAVVVEDTDFVGVDNLPVFIIDLVGDDIAACTWRGVCADKRCALQAFEQVREGRHELSCVVFKACIEGQYSRCNWVRSEERQCSWYVWKGHGNCVRSVIVYTAYGRWRVTARVRVRLDGAMSCRETKKSQRI